MSKKEKEKKNNKKVLIKVIIFIIILIILLIMILIRHYNSTSKENVLELLNSGIESINFSSTYEDGTVAYYYKNICKINYANGDVGYDNYETGESIYISETDKTIEKYSNAGESANVHSSKYIKYFEDDERYQYTYEGTEKVNDENCIVISFLCTDKGSTGSQLLQRFWINKKLGTIEKTESYSYLDGSEELIDEMEYYMHEGNVTESDVEEPNLSEYDDYEIENE